MHLKLGTLTLYCRSGTEVIDLGPRVTFFHGKMSAGKSSIARLIDFCLGAKDVEQTTAIRKELVGVELSAEVGRYAVTFERAADAAGAVQVTWIDDSGIETAALAPLQEPDHPRPIVGDDVFTFSDLMFHLSGRPPVRVRRSTSDEDTPMIRLSFRDLLWYCYLDQNRLDNSFFRLEDQFRRSKSRYAIRYVLGYYTERLETLQGQLSKAAADRAGKMTAAGQIRGVLEELGYAAADDIRTAAGDAALQLDEARGHQAALQTSYHTDTHFADALRERLRGLSEDLGREEQALADLRQRLGEYDALKGELVTARQKLSRAAAAETVLAGVRFDTCPQCGAGIAPRPPGDPACHLCGNAPVATGEDRAVKTQVARRDVEARIRELDDTIARTRRSTRKQEDRVAGVRRDKQDLDRRLDDELSRYDSAFLAARREADRRVATLEERLRGLDRLQKLPDSVQRLEREADQLAADQERLRREVQAEQASLVSANTLAAELESAYLKILLAVGVPGVRPGDRVEINRTTWVPDVLEGGDEGQRWNFYTAGSNGKKTLLNVCYAIAVHEVAEAHDRPLPTLLMVDHPMKCTSPDVNRDVFEAFYRYLYGAARTSLRRTQVVLIDNDYFPPDGGDLPVVERFMTPDDDAHPPLIRYYRGA